MTAPKPPIPANVDLRDFHFMPLDVVKLLNSETWAMAGIWPGASRACVNLWCRAWHQVPAGSLPDQEDILRSWAGVAGWDEVRDIALKGFRKCSDGRLYHDVICREALKAWKRKSLAADEREANRQRNKEFRERKALKYQRSGDASCDVDDPITSLSHDAQMTSMTGTGTGTGTKEKKPPISPSGGIDEISDLDADFKTWYGAYPRKVAPGAARKAYRAARKKTDAATLLAGVEAYQETKADYADWKHPATWLNGECWADEDIAATLGPNGPDEPYRGDYQDDLRRDYLRLMGWIERSFWMDDWGPKPYEDGCGIDPQVMAEHGSRPLMGGK